MDNDLERRIARLEGRLGWREREVELREGNSWFAVALLAAAAGFSVLGLGLPSHYYQVVLAVLLMALCYHRRWLAMPVRWYQWVLPVLGTIVCSMLFKLVIGSGQRHPFFWVVYPALGREEGPDGILGALPHFGFSWQPSPLAAWSIDLTIVQTFLLVVTLAGALFSFQPFISFTAFLLLVISIPAFVEFDWTWVFWALITACIGYYLQAASNNEKRGA